MKNILLLVFFVSTFISCNSTNYINKNDKIFNLDKSLEEIIETKDTEIFRLISKVEISRNNNIHRKEEKRGDYFVGY